MTPDSGSPERDEPETDGGVGHQEQVPPEDQDQPPSEDVGRQTGRPEYVAAADEMDWRGWLLVGLVCVCFLVIPAMVLYLPSAQGFIESLGLSLRQTYLALPMIPAILLGVTAVWAALRTQRTRK